jgi:hypothetical protein
MSRRLRTVASFDLAYKADIVAAALEDAGIEAEVADREIVSMEWLLANAVNGVKVQVAEEDERRALAVVNALYRDGFNQSRVSDEELERQALEAAPPDDSEESPSSEPPVPDTPPLATRADTGDVNRDQYARRFMLCSVFSLVLPPLVIYAFYLGLVTVFGSGPMTSVGWQRVGFGVAFGGIWVTGALWLLTIIL